MTRSCPRTRYVRAWWRQSLVRAWRSWTATTTSRSSAPVSWLDCWKRSWPGSARTESLTCRHGLWPTWYRGGGNGSRGFLTVDRQKRLGRGDKQMRPARSGCQVDIRRGGFAFVVIALLVVALDGPAA